MKNVHCSIIIPNYNGAILLKKNLPRLSKSKENSKNRIAEVIIVDNGSTDDSVAFIKKNYPEIRLIKFQENKGFSKAINVGVKESKGNLVLLLNNDVAVSNNFLEPVYKQFEDPKVFGV